MTKNTLLTLLLLTAVSASVVANHDENDLVMEDTTLETEAEINEGEINEDNVEEILASLSDEEMAALRAEIQEQGLMSAELGDEENFGDELAQDEENFEEEESEEDSEEQDDNQDDEEDSEEEEEEEEEERN